MRSLQAVKINSTLLICRRVEVEDRPTFEDFLGHEILEDRHLNSFGRDLIGKSGWYDNHALCVADDRITKPYGNVAAAGAPGDG